MPFIVIVPIGRDCDWRRAMAMAWVQVSGALGRCWWTKNNTYGKEKKGAAERPLPRQKIEKGEEPSHCRESIH